MIRRRPEHGAKLLNGLDFKDPSTPPKKPTTGQLIKEMNLTSSNFVAGGIGLWINAPAGVYESHSITMDNFYASGAKP